MKYAWIDEHKTLFAVSQMCRALDVSKSGYYCRLKREPSLRTKRNAEIKQDVQRLYDESHGIYGSYKIADIM